jgi:uncharacterized protein
MPPVKIITPAIVIKDTGTTKGRGVFALSSYAENSTVEICPVIIFDDSENAALPLELRRRIFKWSALIGKNGLQRAIALGCGSLYNHANPANLRYRASRITQTLTFSTTRPIEPGEELTINYDEASGINTTAESQWMKREGIVPVT